MDRVNSENDDSILSLSLSISIVFLVFIIISSTVNSFIIKPLLFDGSIIVHGRYAITFDAMDTIDSDESISIVGIGSSITRASIDGTCIENQSEFLDLEIYNLGLSAANPYTEMMQLTALIEAKPDIVMVEAGVNSFWDINTQSRTIGIDENSYIEYRMKLNSILMEESDFGSWVDLIREEDRQFLLQDDYSVYDEKSKYANEALDELLSRLILNNSDARNENSWLRAPNPNDDSWNEYLSTPNYRVGVWENGVIVTDWDRWFEENMENYAEYGEFNPQHSGTLFHSALQHIVEELIGNEILVVLIAAPRNPVIFDYLEPGQTDGLNSSLQNLTFSDRVIVENMFWDSWNSEEFLDRNHLNNAGREKMCQILAPKIDSIISEHIVL